MIIGVGWQLRERRREKARERETRKPSDNIVKDYRSNRDRSGVVVVVGR